MTKVILIRIALFLLPGLVWRIWRQVAKGMGLPPRAAPWGWLVGGGALLAGLSLVVPALLPHGVDRGVYVPAQVQADGRIAPGYFKPPPPARPGGYRQ